MSIKDLIEEKFSSIDNMLESTDVEISRTYLYKLVSEGSINPSLEIIEELARVLEKGVDEIIKAVYRSRYRD